jgi:putative hemolysin
MRITRDELMLVSTMGGSEGALRSDQIRMIHKVLNAGKRTIGKVMVPLVNIAALPQKAPIADFFRTAAGTGYTRIAVYDERTDNVVGFVNMLDLLYAEMPDESMSVGPFVRDDMSFEPETREALTLLNQLQQKRQPLSFVVNEYGGVVGIVTTEDLIEEVVGEIRDETDDGETEFIRRISESIIECDGRAEVQELNEHYDARIPEGDYQTLGGYVSMLMQRIPRQGEKIEDGRHLFMVLDADARRIGRIRMQTLTRSSDTG